MELGKNWGLLLWRMGSFHSNDFCRFSI